jgi:hypothetical protein
MVVRTTMMIVETNGRNYRDGDIDYDGLNRKPGAMTVM